MVAVVSVAFSKERLPSPEASTTSRMLKMTCSNVNLGGNTSPLRRFASEVEINREGYDWTKPQQPLLMLQLLTVPGR